MSLRNISWISYNRHTHILCITVIIYYGIFNDILVDVSFIVREEYWNSDTKLLVNGLRMPQ